ncbi:MAG TPA: hypothetical protein VF006_14385 [Longimicrobium sp.]
MKKLRLHAENLRVESFRTSDAAVRAPGTVQGHADDCTWFASCLCRTAYYQCGTGPHTIYSCNYTYDERCKETSWEQCGTPPATPAC